MNSLQGYKQWQELFDENVSKVYCEERNSKLKIISMMLFSINREIKKVQDDLQNNVLSLRSHIKGYMSATDDNLKSQMFETNNSMLRIPQEFAKLSNVFRTKQLDNDSKELCNEHPSVAISQDDISNQVNRSPEIKKKYRNKDFKAKLMKKRLLGYKTLVAETSLSDKKGVAKLEDSCLKENIKRPNVLDNPCTANTTCKTFKNNALNTCLPVEKYTKVMSESDSDISIVQGTPETRVGVSEQKDKIPTYLQKKVRRKGQNSTITQMFFRKGGLRNHEDVRLWSRNNNSEETLVTLSNRNKMIDTNSAMDITKMVSYINDEPSLEIKDANNGDNAGLIASVRYEDSGDNDTSSLNSAMIEENQSTPVKQVASRDLNALLAKIQNVSTQQEADPVVRGKARKKLPGWACKDCERFYLQQGLNTDEILALNKCSKHRGYSKPREDTVPGFWSMDMSWQETDHNS